MTTLGLCPCSPAAIKEPHGENATHENGFEVLDLPFASSECSDVLDLPFPSDSDAAISSASCASVMTLCSTTHAPAGYAIKFPFEAIADGRTAVMPSTLSSTSTGSESHVLARACCLGFSLRLWSEPWSRLLIRSVVSVRFKCPNVQTLSLLQELSLNGTKCAGQLIGILTI